MSTAESSFTIDTPAWLHRMIARRLAELPIDRVDPAWITATRV